MKVLVHACCGPCSIVPLRELNAQGAEVFALFANPNIHPYTEWERRRDTFTGYAESQGVRLLPTQPYDFTSWMRMVAHRESRRCELCFYQRLSTAAAFAAKGGFDAFTSTLLYSKFQNHGLLKEIGEAAAKEAGVEFYYSDWRNGWKEGVDESKRLGMYRQQYCGCILSEEERYGKKGGKK